MSEVVLKVENLSKIYRLGQVGTGTISHDLNRAWAKLRGKEDPYAKVGQVNDRTQKAKSDYVYALKDINFEVKRGEILGIIGKNGAGKSTLLKLISQITSPSTGSIKAKGRIASLLEVGTVMHPEMTARENIYLNGAILGMRKYEIDRKFDEILDFAGCAMYVDTPIKRFSSGMSVRLGFAVAAFLEPEILIVDEVLAVGDAEFQKKAIGKMKDVSSNEGRTVLFVSHNMGSIRSLCTNGLILKNGGIEFEGNTEECVSKYLKGDTGIENFISNNDLSHLKNDKVEIETITIKASNKELESPIYQNNDIVLSFVYNQKTSDTKLHITFHLKDEYGNIVFTSGSGYLENNNTVGNFNLKAIIPKDLLNWGTYYIDLYVVENKKAAILIEKDILSFTVLNKSQELGTYMNKEKGVILPKLKWEKNLYG